MGHAILPLIPHAGVSRTVLNIGDGLGYNGQGIKSVLQEYEPNVSLVALELSPALLQAQRARGSADLIIPGNALQIPFPEGSLAGIVANEIIADFATTRFTRDVALKMQREVKKNKRVLTTINGEDSLWDRKKISEFLGDRFNLHLRQRTDWAEVIDCMLTYDLPIPKRSAVKKEVNTDIIRINTGSIRFLEGVARVLQPGGFAWISEYGSLDPSYYPIKPPGLKHEEWSIKFDHLLLAANKLGLTANVIPLIDALPFNKHAWYTLTDDMRAVTLHELYKQAPDAIRNFHLLLNRDKKARLDPNLEKLVQDYGINIFGEEDFQQHTTFNRLQGKPPMDIQELNPLPELVQPFYVLVLKKE